MQSRLIKPAESDSPVIYPLDFITEQMRKHDWYFEYSDDHRTYQSGIANECNLAQWVINALGKWSHVYGGPKGMIKEMINIAPEQFRERFSNIINVKLKAQGVSLEIKA
jgi:hypothetical protein